MLNVPDGRQGTGRRDGQVAHRVERAQPCAHTGSHAPQPGILFRKPSGGSMTCAVSQDATGTGKVGWLAWKTGGAEPRLPE